MADSRSRVLGAILPRIFAGVIVAVTLTFLFNDYLIFWLGWPGAMTFLEHKQWFGLGSLISPLKGYEVTLGWLQFLSYAGSIFVAAAYVCLTPTMPLRLDAARLSAMAAYIVRAAFWSVLLIGLVDLLISFLRVEGLLESLIGTELTQELGKSRFRGVYVHYPLMALSLIIAWFIRSLGFIWLAFLIVIAEFQIVISRFVFSYEQAFLADLVRFWYAALFLFAASYTLVHDGHVRVDVFYARFSSRKKAWANAVGSIMLGIPLCWIILTTGMWGRGNSINSPLLSFEISQSGFGMYVKYLMAGFLVVFAVTMTVQFTSYFLSSVATVRGEPSLDHTAARAGPEDAPVGASV